MKDDDRPFRIPEAAAYLGISKGYLYNLVHAGKITHHKPSVKVVLFQKQDLDAYVCHHTKLADFEVNRQAEDILNRN